jgi:hypothetical protein
VLAPRWLCLAVASAFAVLVVSACGLSGGSSNSGSSAAGTTRDCGEASDVLAGDFGGSAGGKAYLDVEGKPVVSRAGRGTSCTRLRALADAYAHKSGDDFLAWLVRNTWIWLNHSATAGKRSTFDLGKNDVFIGIQPGQRSQVAFHTG